MSQKYLMSDYQRIFSMNLKKEITFKATKTPSKPRLKPASHQPYGSRAPFCDDKFLGFVRQPQGVVNNTARLPYEKQGRKAAAA